MSNYIPNYRKKMRICGRREAVLRRLVDGGTAPREKIIAAALMVRDARIRVLRARRATIPPVNHTSIEFYQIDRKIRRLELMTDREILEEFGYSPVER